MNWVFTGSSILWWIWYNITPYVPQSLEFLCFLVLSLPNITLILTHHFWGYSILTLKSHKHGPLSIVVELLTLALGLQIYNNFGTMIYWKQIKSLSPSNIPGYYSLFLFPELNSMNPYGSQKDIQETPFSKQHAQGESFRTHNSEQCT